MFRNPRENTELASKPPLKPSIGRPPTPPNDTTTPRHQSSSAMAARGSTKPLTPRPNSKSNTPILGRQGTKKIPASRTPAKPQNSILNFFKKVDAPVKDDSVFLSKGASEEEAVPLVRGLGVDLLEENLYNDSPRFNEAGGSVKRRKTSQPDINQNGVNESNCSAALDVDAEAMGASGQACTPPPEKADNLVSKRGRRKGPFLSDSEESEDENENERAQERAVETEKLVLMAAVCKQPAEINELVVTRPTEQDKIKENRPVVPVVDSAKPIDAEAGKRQKMVPGGAAQAKEEALQSNGNSSKSSDLSLTLDSDENFLKDTEDLPAIPSMKKEETSVDDWGKFDDLDEFPDDDFAEGEEFIERKWMEEQARLEAAEGAEDGNYDVDDFERGIQTGGNLMTATCPICSSSLSGFGADEATRHVNGCLDGNPIPFPKPVKEEPSEHKLMPPGANSRFARKAAIARPGQANPFEIESSGAGPSTAFSKLMSGHAEDAAWATAAAAEHASRGKPAYQRTCPFYKIMPGFFICVDAFRYGAVQGCNAYFLSHFHSDHYVGLTSTWCHGPIYCSKVTGNLVKQQLRVDPKWVICLEFEARVEVPETQGVAVTMIPANHCPGSSLFLFEKVIGRGSTPRIQRVLHCGDFRACPAHVAHPLLMPDIVDSINGKTKQQKIDVCYLDTTYLNPRYAFPSQEEVIKACADMCVSLKKERAEENDAWESVKRDRAGGGMANFVSSVKANECTAIDINRERKSRGRLLVICGTYSIGKERICMGIARALDCKIWAAPGKQRICAALEDEELMSRMTDDPREAQIHMQMLMEIRPETLKEYLEEYKPWFSRIVAFRPSGWNYRPPNSRFVESPQVSTVLHSDTWRSHYSLADLVPQRGSTREAACFGVPYSEHSSFRELTMFICALRIEKVVPTVNVGTAAGRAKMKAWVEKWIAERRKGVGGVVRVGSGDGEIRW